MFLPLWWSHHNCAMGFAAPPAPLQVTFRDPVRYRLDKQLTIAAEGLYTGQVRWQLLG